MESFQEQVPQKQIPMDYRKILIQNKPRSQWKKKKPLILERRRNKDGEVWTVETVLKTTI
jgi:hypothetical protein